ncbi:MAG: hypothetical protein NC548_45625 [Lachnospiraceae bacterium]|nr:hypothetical protein [Lachnospiraceae bacterium]
MARNDILVVSPSIEWAKKRWEECYEYIQKNFPAGTLRVRRLEIVIGDEGHRIRFTSRGLQDHLTRGFRGTVIDEGNHIQMLEEIIKDVIKHDAYKPAEVEEKAINIIVACDHAHVYVFENFVVNISDKLRSCQVRRSDWTIIVNGIHKIAFKDSDKIVYEPGTDCVILTEESFNKYDSMILEAMNLK